MNKRKALLAKVHIAKQQLGLDDATYRLMLRESAGVTSAADLDDAGLARLIEQFRARGWTQKREVPRYKGRPRVGGDREGLVKKIEALLAEAKRPWSYADGVAKRVCKVERIAFCDVPQLGKVVAALMYDARRHGRPTA